MSDHETLEYGPVQADQIETVNALLEQALTFGIGGMGPWTEAIGHAHMRVVRRGGRAVSGMSTIPMGHYIGGRVVPAGGITAVGVAPDQRGSGVGLYMIRQSLLELRRQNVPLASLYPATTAFYRRAGFERAAQRIIYEVPLAALSLRDYSLEAAPAAPDEYAIIKQLYAQQGARTPGFIDRPDFYWDQFLEPREKRTYKFIARRDGVPEGYVVFFHAANGEPLKVRDMVALTPGAGRRLLTLLADHRSMLEVAHILGGPNDALLFLMPEQKQKVHWALDLMLRIVDVAGALSARGYPPALAAELHLDVQDDLIEANNGRFVLSVEGGRGAAQAGGQGHLRLHTRGLAALYTGYLGPHELQAAGLLGGSPEALAAAGLVFAGPRPWLPDMF